MSAASGGPDSRGDVQTFGAPWGLSLVIMSALVTAVLAVVFWCVPLGEGLVAAWPQLLVAAIFVSALLFIVKRYELTPDAILIPRLFWTTRIPRAGLLEATVEPRAMKGSVRLFGNGGMYVFNGWFWNKPLGRYSAFVTNPEKTVVLRFADRTVVVSPARPEEFVRALTAERPQ